MGSHRRSLPLVLGVLVLIGFVSVAEGSTDRTDPVPVRNWAAPSTWRPGTNGIRPLSILSDVSGPLPFIPITPCRTADTRGNGFTVQAGPPSLTAGASRTFQIGGTVPGVPTQCGVPLSASAVSLNITVTNTQGPGFISMYPPGPPPSPLVSTLNYLAGQTLANAAVVPLGSGNVTVVAGVSGTDLIIDVNGYYSSGSASARAFSLRGNISGSVIFAQNDSTSCVGSCGILSSVTGDGGTFVNPADAMRAVVEGNGVGVGVSGVAYTTADGSTGVFGQDDTEYHPPASALSFRAGVQGTSKDAVGVVGQSRNSSVVGQLRDTSDFPTFYGILGTTFGTASDATMGPWGVFSGGNFGATGTKHFVEPHPTNPKKVILYSTVEGRTVDTTFRGTARLVDHTAVIEVPEDFRIVTDEEGVTVQITPVGAYSQIYIESQDLNRVVVRGSKDVQFHYQITGLRRAFKDLAPVQTGYIFMPQSPSDRIPAYLTEEARRRLISNGTYNEDGTVNMETAEKAGFTRIWADRKAQAQAVAEEARKAAQNEHP